MAQEKKKEPSFEEAVKKLEEIVGRMESGEVGLDDLIASFEEGRKLVDFCTGKLSEVEKKIEKLVKTPDGKIAAEAFEAKEA